MQFSERSSKDVEGNDTNDNRAERSVLGCTRLRAGRRLSLLCLRFRGRLRLLLSLCRGRSWCRAHTNSFTGVLGRVPGLFSFFLGAALLLKALIGAGHEFCRVAKAENIGGLATANLCKRGSDTGERAGRVSILGSYTCNRAKGDSSSGKE